jgi:maleate isomerase
VDAVTSGPAAIGVVTPYDMALDRELWRWAPDDVSLLFTRTPYAPLEVTLEMAQWISCHDTVGGSVRALSSVEPAVYAYACTTGSFSAGVPGELALVEAMQAAGAPAAVTTSGAFAAALRRLGVSSVAIATPYDEEVTARLATFLAEAGCRVPRYACLELHRDIWRVPYSVTADLVRDADTPEAEAVLVSCTNLATYDLIAPLEAELGKPVVTANQVTMWAALSSIGRSAVGPGQHLLDRVAAPWGPWVSPTCGEAPAAG